MSVLYLYNIDLVVVIFTSLASSQFRIGRGLTASWEELQSSRMSLRLVRGIPDCLCKEQILFTDL